MRLIKANQMSPNLIFNCAVCQGSLAGPQCPNKKWAAILGQVNPIVVPLLIDDQA